MVHRDVLGVGACGDPDLDLAPVQVFNRRLFVLFRLEPPSDHRGALDVRARSDGMADRAARPRTQSLRPHRALCRGLVRVSARGTLLAQGLRAQQDSGGVLRSDDDRRHGRTVGDRRMALRRHRRRRGGGGVPRFPG